MDHGYANDDNHSIYAGDSRQALVIQPDSGVIEKKTRRRSVETGLALLRYELLRIDLARRRYQGEAAPCASGSTAGKVAADILGENTSAA